MVEIYKCKILYDYVTIENFDLERKKKKNKGWKIDDWDSIRRTDLLEFRFTTIFFT
jgi:hypothetical protein